jgi:hypothetical protein
MGYFYALLQKHIIKAKLINSTGMPLRLGTLEYNKILLYRVRMLFWCLLYWLYELYEAYLFKANKTCFGLDSNSSSLVSVHLYSGSFLGCGSLRSLEMYSLHLHLSLT